MQLSIELVTLSLLICLLIYNWLPNLIIFHELDLLFKIYGFHTKLERTKRRRCHFHSRWRYSQPQIQESVPGICRQIDRKDGQYRKFQINKINKIY